MILSFLIALNISLFSSNSVASPDFWLPPLDRPLEVQESFLRPPAKYAAGHRGIDLSASNGEKVMSPTSGIVTFSGIVVDRPLITLKTNTGLLLTIEPLTTDHVAGDTVERGEILGQVAEGAHCSNSCIHIGVRKEDFYINPLRFFMEKPKLLPTL